MNEHTTVVVGVDTKHIDELRVAWPTWKEHKPDIMECQLMLVCDMQAGTREQWELRLDFVDHPNKSVVVFDGTGIRLQGGDQREVMLTALVWAAAHVSTRWFVKIDTDTVARDGGVWAEPEWFDQGLAFVSHRWGYTRPARFIRMLDDWSLDVPELCDMPKPLDDLPADLDGRVSHKRIQSWFMLGTSQFARLAWLLVSRTEDCRMPCPSQDTYLWYLAKRIGWEYKAVNLKSRGWDHGRGALRDVKERQCTGTA